ncbi:MAG: NfeD family protein [Lachnospiraceae bacterium]|nr:NfeD family protein [Lachnospiraceae bacterium]
MLLTTPPIGWLVLLIVLLAVEAVTLGLTTIWFAGGAAVAFIAALFGANFTVQMAVFVVLSLVLLIVTRPLAVRYMQKDHVRTNADGLIGQHALVTEAINNLDQAGEVKIADVGWMARSRREADIIPVGSRVRICAIEGVKLIVEEIKEEN